MNYTSQLRKKIIFIPALIMGVGIFFSCENDLEEIERITFQKDAPQETFEVVTMEYKDSAFTRAILEAPKVNRFYGSNERMEFPSGLKVTFYQPILKKESQLTADFGEYRQRQHELYLRSKVVFINFMRTDTLFTEELTWSQLNPDSSKIHTEKMVIIKTKNAVLKSEGVYANETFSFYRFIRPHDSYFYTNSEE